MSNQDAFKARLAQLQETLEEKSKGISSVERCLPTMVIAGLATPLVLLALFYFLQPSFVQRKEANKYVRDGKKVFFWAMGCSVVVWIALYLLTACQGFEKLSMVCSR